MKELLQRWKMDVMLTAVICIAVGVVLILYPVETTRIACKIVGIVLAALGLIRVISFLMENEKRVIPFSLGLVQLILGIWIFLKPESIQNLILIGVGVALFVHGIEDFRYAWETKQGGYDKWWVLLLLALLSMIFGIVCIVDCFGVISVAMTFVGAVLIYDGLSDFWIISRVHSTEKKVRRQTEIVDAEYEESEM